jgi:hypothetical protein
VEYIANVVVSSAGGRHILGFGNAVETALKSIYGAFNAGAVERPLIAGPDFSDKAMDTNGTPAQNPAEPIANSHEVSPTAFCPNGGFRDLITRLDTFLGFPEILGLHI